MNIKASPFKIEQLYKNHLSKINNIDFTPRQIDVLSCLIHKRNYGRIAEILQINSTRTVHTHIRGKLQNISVEDVIDFIDSSGVRKQLAECYFHILAAHYFSKKLKAIKLLNRSKINISFTQELVSSIDSALLAKLTRDMEEVNIIHSADNIDYIIGLQGDKEADFTFKINSNAPPKTHDDFTNGYYEPLLKALHKIINKDEVLDISKNFAEEIESLEKSWQGVATKSPTNTIIDPFANKKKVTRFKISIFCILMVITLITASYFMVREYTRPDTEKIKEQLAQYVTKISANNVIKVQKNINYDCFKKVQSLADKFDDYRLREYYTGPEVTSEQLMDCLYVLHAISCYYQYNHDGVAARRVLGNVKEIVEKYIILRTSGNIDFKDLSYDEIYAELSVVKGLAELYTRVIYAYGRTYVYQGNVEDGRECFRLAEYLGKKMVLYEGYAGDFNGTRVINKKLISDYLDSKNYDILKEFLKKEIEKTNAVFNDNTQYLLDYSHKKSRAEHNVMIPASNDQNLGSANLRLITYYFVLLKIEHNRPRMLKYAGNIERVITKPDGLYAFLNNGEMSDRMKSKIINSICDVMILLHKRKINNPSIVNVMSRITGRAYDDNLDLVINLLSISKSRSKYNDFTKADAYDCLAAVYKLKVKEQDVSKEDMIRYKNNITRYLKNRDTINKELHRVGWRLKRI